MAFGPHTQLEAIEATPPDTPTPIEPTPDVPAAPLPGNENPGKDIYGKTAAEGGSWDKPYDEQWTHILRNRLLKSGMVSEADISEQALMDPHHRKWLNDLLKKWEQNQKPKVAQGGGGEETPPGEEQAPTPEGSPESQVPATLPPAASNNNVKPRVLASGRLPSGEVFETTAGPWGTGWIPAGEGLYWPPWPTAGGPIAKPDPRRRMGVPEPMPKTLTAEGQADAMEG